jgi:hypothetical protein
MEPLGSDIRAELTRHGPQAGMAELVERWPLTVGESIARNAWPARIARDGTVHANTTDSVWAFEIAQKAGENALRLCVPKDAELARAIASSITDETLRESVQKAVSLSLARGRSDTRI